MKLAEEDCGKRFALETSSQFIDSELLWMISDLVKIISLLNRMDSFHRLHLDVQAEESEFQASAPCANLIKIKKHFQFILTHYSIA